MKVYSGNSVRKIENACFASGISEERLMENAGSACAKVIKSEIPDISTKRTVILCGKGKNGGDGFVIARKLFEIGMKPVIILTGGNPTIREPIDMLERARELGIRILQFKTDSYRCINEIKESELIIDCIFGIGYHGEPDEFSSLVFDVVNASNAYTVSIDIPSGIDSEGSDYAPNHIIADMTVSISVLKPAHLKLKAACGKLKVVNIGIEERFFELEKPVLQISEPKDIKAYMPKRPFNANKGTFGHLLNLCGSYQMPGAAVMSGKAAIGSGAGKVTVAFPDKAYTALTAHMYECMFLPLKSDEEGFFGVEAAVPAVKATAGKSCVLAGCGIGQSQGARETLYSVIREADCPLVIDADGINLLSRNIDLLKSRSNVTVLTPHIGEFSRLTGHSIDEIKAHKQAYAQRFADEYGVILVLKGNDTVIACKGETLYLNTTGNAGLAQGGTGDVLAGLLAGFIAQGIEPVKAAVCAAYIHGEAGDICAEKYSQRGMTPHHLLDELPSVLKKYSWE